MVAVAVASFVGGCYYKEADYAESKIQKAEKKQTLEDDNRKSTADIDKLNVKDSNDKIDSAVSKSQSDIDRVRSRAGTVPQTCAPVGMVHGAGGPNLVRGADLEDIGRDVKSLQQDSGELGKRGAQCARKLTACQEKIKIDQKMAAGAD